MLLVFNGLFPSLCQSKSQRSRCLFQGCCILRLFFKIQIIWIEIAVEVYMNMYPSIDISDIAFYTCILLLLNLKNNSYQHTIMRYNIPKCLIKRNNSLCSWIVPKTSLAHNLRKQHTFIGK